MGTKVQWPKKIGGILLNGVLNFGVRMMTGIEWQITGLCKRVDYFLKNGYLTELFSKKVAYMKNRKN